MHPLDGAYKRIDRAGEHLIDIDTLSTGLYQTAKNKIIFYLDNPLPVDSPKGQRTYASLGRAEIDIPVPESISILVGETIYNIRAALDYLVYELAVLDSGIIQEHTQFPIEDSPKGFITHKSYLKGINLKHRACIENLQPYRGCDWTKSIRDISNPDKHRKLTLFICGAIFEATDYRTKTHLSSKTVDVDADLTFLITFSDGTPIKNRLEKLKLNVTKTLDSFYPEFK